MIIKSLKRAVNKVLKTKQDKTYLLIHFYKSHSNVRSQSNYFIGEFDPGSGRTLAACLIHASRADRWELAP